MSTFCPRDIGRRVCFLSTPHLTNFKLTTVVVGRSHVKMSAKQTPLKLVNENNLRREKMFGRGSLLVLTKHS